MEVEIWVSIRSRKSFGRWTLRLTEGRLVKGKRGFLKLVVRLVLHYYLFIIIIIIIIIIFELT